MATYVCRIYGSTCIHPEGQLNARARLKERTHFPARKLPQLSSNRLVIPALLLKPLSRVSIDLSSRDYFHRLISLCFLIVYFKSMSNHRRTFHAFQRESNKSVLLVTGEMIIRIRSRFTFRSDDTLDP